MSIGSVRGATTISSTPTMAVVERAMPSASATMRRSGPRTINPLVVVGTRYPDVDVVSERSDGTGSRAT